MGHDEDTKVLHSMGYAQELSRRMGGFSNFAISFSIICILAGGITSYPLAMGTGGGFQATIGWIVGGLFALVVATSLADIASAYPTAGGLYHWSSIRWSRLGLGHGLDQPARPDLRRCFSECRRVAIVSRSCRFRCFSYRRHSLDRAADRSATGWHNG